MQFVKPTTKSVKPLELIIIQAAKMLKLRSKNNMPSLGNFEGSFMIPI